MVEVTQQENGSTIPVGVGDQLAITLQENASTGYQWAVDSYDPALLTDLGSKPAYPDAPLGSGGQVTFTFEAVATGSASIQLKQWRAWEGESSVIERFHVRVDVQG